MKLTSHVISETGPVRHENQDAAAELPDAGLFVVADGMGGHAGGREASRIVREGLAVSSPGTDLVASIREANRKVFEHARSAPELKGMGSTVVVLHLTDRGGTLLHVGDSRAYRLRGDALERLTDDHSFVRELISQGQITTEDARKHPYRHMLTRAVGVNADVEPEQRAVDVAAGDVFLLCTDGVSGTLSEEEIKRLLALGRRSPEEACRALVDAAIAAGGRDNATAIVVHVEER